MTPRETELCNALMKAGHRIEQLCHTVNTLSCNQGLGQKVRAEDFTDIIRAAIAKAQS